MAAAGVLQSRLVEVPAIATAVVRHIDRHAESIEFRVDYEEQYAPLQSEPVRLDRLVVSEDEQKALAEGLARLGIPREGAKKS